jgi:hypothetical protein
MDLKFDPDPTIKNLPVVIWRSRLYTLPRFPSPKTTVGRSITSVREGSSSAQAR